MKNPRCPKCRRSAAEPEGGNFWRCLWCGWGWITKRKTK